MEKDVIICGDCFSVLKTFDDNSVNCCVTSPPYWGLRDYGVKGQFGLEKTFGEYVSKMVAIFREIKRVLKNDGTVWLNLGDSYNGGGSAVPVISLSAYSKGGLKGGRLKRWCDFDNTLKIKDLVGIPWRVAFALQADDWYLRQDIIWHKPNPMPESVKDRCTKAHEYIFLLSKNQKYYFDAGAIKEKAKTFDNSVRDIDKTKLNNTPGRARMGGLKTNNYETRNKRSVWSIPTKPFKGAHFAVFPEALVEPCILAGSPKGGIVLDPFMGAGTTAVVAHRNNRHFIGIELNKEYIAIAKQRLSVTERIFI